MRLLSADTRAHVAFIFPREVFSLQSISQINFFFSLSLRFETIFNGMNCCGQIRYVIIILHHQLRCALWLSAWLNSPLFNSYYLYIVAMNATRINRFAGQQSIRFFFVWFEIQLIRINCNNRFIANGLCRTAAICFDQRPESQIIDQINCHCFLHSAAINYVPLSVRPSQFNGGLGSVYSTLHWLHGAAIRLPGKC